MNALHVVAVLSIVIGIIAGVVLFAFSVYTYRQRTTGKALLTAAAMSLAYPVSVAFTARAATTFTLELLLLGAWLTLLLRALGLSPTNVFSIRMRWLGVVAALSTAAVFIALIRIWLPDVTAIEDSSWFAGTRLMLSLAALIVIEQLVRNTRDDLKARMRYLNIGLGAYFIFSLGDSISTLLLRHSVEVLQAVKPAEAAIPIPFVIIASLRNADHPLRLNLSKEFIFSGGVLITAGVTLLLTALIAYYVGLTDRQTGLATLVLLSVLAMALLFVVAGSSRTQAWAQRLIGRHLLTNQHDYRAHWNRVTQQLIEADPDFTLEQQSIRALLVLFHAPAGALWTLQGQSLVQTATVHSEWSSPLPPETVRTLEEKGQALDEIIDLRGAREPAFQYLSEELGLRFLVPLVSFRGLFGVVGVSNPLTALQLSDEDREIVRLTARQIAGFLALREADRNLARSRQFESMHQLTTFLVHDLKTTSSQLGLVLENAERHRENPAFVDDMLDTVANAVERLDRLLNEVRGNGQTIRSSTVSLEEILPDVVASFAQETPRPILEDYNSDATIYVDRHRLTSALQHLLQNAIEACNEEDRITLRSESRNTWIDLIIEDTGAGMDREYVESKLFAPFETTKGVNGMGIGVFQARESVRAMGGDLLVDSLPGVGTCFTIRLPVNHSGGD